MKHRPIILKARKIHKGDWVEGHPIYSWKGKEGYSLDSVHDLSNTNEYSIEEETVCHYTGLDDGQGKRIYENDIIELGDDERGYELWSVYFSKVIGQYRLTKMSGQGELNLFPYNKQGIIKENMHDGKK